jgi:hypothetical protein
MKLENEVCFCTVIFCMLHYSTSNHKSYLNIIIENSEVKMTFFVYLGRFQVFNSG